MTEKKILVDDLRIHYTGIFSVSEFFKLLDNLIVERGYTRQEKKSEEKVKPTGKDIYLELRPQKEFEMDYHSMIKIRVKMTDVKKVVIERNGKRMHYDQGHILVIIDGWSTTIVEYAWETKPLFAFFKMLFDKYVYKLYFAKYHGEIVTDAKYFRDRIRGHLNLYRYSAENTSSSSSSSSGHSQSPGHDDSTHHEDQKDPSTNSTQRGHGPHTEGSNHEEHGDHGANHHHSTSHSSRSEEEHQNHHPPNAHEH